jgi:AraC-like DNA-binding protein
MRPLFEKVAVPAGSSWALLDRRLEDGIPFQWHYHPEFELTLTLNSRGQRYIGDSITSYEDGDLVLLGPNVPHTWNSTERLIESRPHQAIVMWFTEEWAAKLTGGLAEMRPVEELLARAGRGLAFSYESSRRARKIIETIPGRSPADRLLRLVEVLILLAQDPYRQPIAGPGAQREKLASPDQSRIGRVLDHIHAHYREPISNRALSEVAALSPSGFHRLFRRHTQLTVGDYVGELRIGQACALLVNSERPVARIAEEVGYNSLANFNRQFRRLKGVTPREFRRRFAGSR